MSQNAILGIDVGATGIKGGLVDVEKGVMLTERHRFDTPKSGLPKDIAATVGQLVDHFWYEGKVGVGFPAIVRRGVAGSAANIHKSWIGTSITETFQRATGLTFAALNDADAAGIASMRFGIGQPYRTEGTVLMVTIGTGLGGALFVDGHLMPNLEVGQVYLRDHKKIVEKYVSNYQRKSKGWTWDEFGKRFAKFIEHVDLVFNPDLIILGGGASKHFKEYGHYLHSYAEVRPATLRNTAGTIGAAIFAAEHG